MRVNAYTEIATESETMKNRSNELVEWILNCLMDDALVVESDSNHDIDRCCYRELA